MSVRLRRATRLLALCASLAVTGCAAKVDLSKQDSPRSTIPATQGLDQSANPSTSASSTKAPVANDPAFTSVKLRPIDPCALLDKDTVAKAGQPAQPTDSRSDFAECAVYTKDTAGHELTITLTLGETLIETPDKFNDNIGGLPGTEHKDGDGTTGCFQTVATETSPNRGIRVQLTGSNKDLCSLAKAVLEAALNRIRNNAPQFDLGAKSLVGLDTCTLLDDQVISAAVGPGATKTPSALHSCNYDVNHNFLAVGFRIGYDPTQSSTTATKPVDLGGGLTAREKIETSPSYAQCTIEWPHRVFSGDQFEIASADLTHYNAPKDDDPCTPLLAVAKALRTKLPA